MVRAWSPLKVASKTFGDFGWPVHSSEDRGHWSWVPIMISFFPTCPGETWAVGPGGKMSIASLYPARWFPALSRKWSTD